MIENDYLEGIEDIQDTQEDIVIEDITDITPEISDEIEDDEYFPLENEEVLREYLEEQTHGSADSQLELLCRKRPSWCDKIVWSWYIPQTDKAGYTAQYFVIFDFLDKSLTRWEDIKQKFQILTINNASWKRRWGANAKKITINLDSFWDTSEFWQVLTHEFWHVVDLWVLCGKSKKINNQYTEFWKAKFSVDDPSLEYYEYSWDSETIRSAKVVKKDFCSGYWMSDPFEDFAECQNLFLNNRKLFQTMAKESSIMKNKYNYFANLYDNQILFDWWSKMQYEGWRPWDTTVI